MNQQIKKYVDAGDIKSLKYIFVDALDVDPTFERYKEEYDYCKSLGLLEPHIEMTAFQSDENQWNEEYWTSLKMDLMQNFSDERMAHMREVAKVFLSEKMEKILAERKEKTAGKTDSISPSTLKATSTSEKQEERRENPIIGPRAEEQQRQLEEDRKKLAAQNREQAERIAREASQRAARVAEQLHEQEKSEEQTKAFPIKEIGIVAAVAVVAVVIVLILK